MHLALSNLTRLRALGDAEEYVRGNVHTNSIENFCGLFKVGIKGTYVSVEPFRLFRYLDDNFSGTRKDNDQARFIYVRSSQGKRVEYKDLIGQTTI